MRRLTRRGLTLIEVLIVIAILLAIGGLVAVNLLPKKEQADIDLTSVQIDSFANALSQFKLDMKRFPTEEEGIRALWSKAAIEDEDEATRWKGPYLEQPLTKDTWDREWQYYFPAEEREDTYEIVSLGPDGEEDTDDDISSLDRFRGADGELDGEFEDFGDGDLGS